MSSVASAPAGQVRLGKRAVLWIGAAAAALSAHGGAVLWAMHQPPMGSAGPAPVPAILIDMAPAQAAPANAQQAAPDLADAPEITAPDKPAPVAPPPTVQPDLPLDLPEPPRDLAGTPPPDLPPPLPDAVSLPEAMPAPTLRPRTPATAETPRPPKKLERPAAAKETKRATSPDAAPPAPQAPAQSANAGGGPAGWQTRLMAHLERLKRYPPGSRQRREEGVVLVRFSIDGSGNVLSVDLQRSSGFSELDDAVLALIRRASPVPAPPPDAPHSISAPVRFYMK